MSNDIFCGGCGCPGPCIAHSELTNVAHECVNLDILGKCKECGADRRELADAFKEAEDEAVKNYQGETMDGMCAVFHLVPRPQENEGAALRAIGIEVAE